MAEPYFTNFPVIGYDIAKDKKLIFTRDLFRSFRIRPEVIDNRGAYYLFDIPGADSPEILADKLYGSVHLYWVFFMMNQSINPLWDWPLTQRQFEGLMVDKYPGNALRVADLTGSFTVGETLTGGTSLVTSVVVSVDKNNFNTASATAPLAKVVVSGLSGTYTADEVITGGTSANTATFKTAVENPDADNHFVDANGVRVEAIHSGAVVVSNRTHEDNKNESKRKIKVLRKEFIPAVVEEFKNILTT